MEYKIEKRIIPDLPDIPLASSRFIIAHESGNLNNTGPNSLENEVRFMTANWRTAFTSHFVGSGGRIVQLAPVGRFQYGAGPKANPYAYAQVELARTNDPDIFKKDYAAYIWLLRKLADDAGLPRTLDAGSGVYDRGIKSHDWIRQHIGGTTHTDPYGYFAQFGISRAQFEKDVEKGTASQLIAKPEVKPAAPKTSGYTGNSIVDYLKSIGKESSPAYRRQLAKEYGVEDYDLSVSKNLELLNKMRVDHYVSKPMASGAGTYTGNSIVDYLKSIGMDSSPAHRRQLAKEFGVDNYDFSAEKNLELLREMRDSPPNARHKGTVHLPADAETWRTYKLNVLPVKKNSDWSLTPSRFGGLTYEILDHPYPDVVTINTSRGKRNIYVGPGTGAVIE
ncbi:DUF3597 family protein [Siminovitchia acidinfaciens]|uniref:Autolysin n=1 Tax=Siminovitchia acidinfaciens TaxID=2321395 RepID=A0A429XVJ3_9BACI|nr:DUF3597 family protein [Siminovitchia acidinfaciens]RST72282.1 DUF3597 family protein [Siminovitchia acidinfaciens]